MSSELQSLNAERHSKFWHNHIGQKIYAGTPTSMRTISNARDLNNDPQPNDIKILFVLNPDLGLDTKRRICLRPEYASKFQNTCLSPLFEIEDKVSAPKVSVLGDRPAIDGFPDL